MVFGHHLNCLRSKIHLIYLFQLRWQHVSACTSKVYKYLCTYCCHIQNKIKNIKNSLKIFSPYTYLSYVHYNKANVREYIFTFAWSSEWPLKMFLVGLKRRTVPQQHIWNLQNPEIILGRGEYFHQKLKLFRDAPKFSKLFQYKKLCKWVKFVDTFVKNSCFLCFWAFFAKIQE